MKSYEICLSYSFLLIFNLFLESEGTKFSTELLTANKEVGEMIFREAIADNDLPLAT